MAACEMCKAKAVQTFEQCAQHTLCKQRGIVIVIAPDASNSIYTLRSVYKSGKRTKWKFGAGKTSVQLRFAMSHCSVFFVSFTFSLAEALAPSSPSSHYLFLIWSVIEISMSTPHCEHATENRPQEQHRTRGVWMVYILFSSRANIKFPFCKPRPSVCRSLARAAFGSMCANFQLQFMRNCEWNGALSPHENPIRIRDTRSLTSRLGGSAHRRRWSERTLVTNINEISSVGYPYILFLCTVRGLHGRLAVCYGSRGGGAGRHTRHGWPLA